MFRNPVTDLLVVLAVVLLIFGPKRLPMLGRSLGQGLREFKDSITGSSKDEVEDRPELGAAQTTPTVANDAVPTPAEAQVSQQAPAAQAQPAAATAPPPAAPGPPPAATAATEPPPAATEPPSPATTPPERESAEVGSSEHRA
jgi:sec-independent protein translocase protein TatA